MCLICYCPCYENPFIFSPKELTISRNVTKEFKGTLKTSKYWMLYYIILFVFQIISALNISLRPSITHFA